VDEALEAWGVGADEVERLVQAGVLLKR
jgi:hypothetical protein